MSLTLTAIADERDDERREAIRATARDADERDDRALYC